MAYLKPCLPQVGASLKDLSQVLYPLEEGQRGFPLAREAYPLEAYLGILRVEGVFPGIYHYKEHHLSRIQSGPDLPAWKEALWNLPLEKVAVIPALTLVSEHSEALFGLRGYRYALLEAGYAAGLILLTSVGLELRAYLAETFYDEGLTRLLNLPKGEHPGVGIFLGR